jgi:citrate synthase
MVFLLVCGRLPEERQRRLMDGVLVTLMEHGLTPSAAAARMTYSVAPESIQGAVAAGLLGAGSLVLGSMEGCGHLLTCIDAEVREGASEQQVIEQSVNDLRQRGERVPGLGHSIHTNGDPRAVRLFEIGAECGMCGDHVRRLGEVSRIASRLFGHELPINATGAIAAILLELGVPWQLHRGFALISRTAGLVAHIAEERALPITPPLRQLLRQGERA